HRIERFVADDAKHLRDLVRVRADMAFDERVVVLERAEGSGLLGHGLGTLAGAEGPRARTRGAPLSFCLRVRGWGANPTPCTFGAGFDRSLQSCPRRRYVGLSDYGRCAFGSRPGGPGGFSRWRV